METIDIIAAAPLICMTFGIVALLLLDLFRIDALPFPRLWWGVGICAATGFLFWPFLTLSETAFHGMMAVDAFTFAFALLILGGSAVTFMLSDELLEGQRIEPSADLDLLVLFAALGGIMMVAATHMMMLFVGFELLSICVYVLTGAARYQRASSEGALKYFILGAFSSAFLLYGMALVYGATGSMYLSEIGRHIGEPSMMLLIGLGLLIFGFGFKVSLVPFHFWTPDVYQGAPTSMTGFMAVVVKAAAFGAFFRLMATGFGGISGSWSTMVAVLAVLSMTIGNVIALRQTSVKRMLAYSSIAHAGYAMLGFLALGTGGGAAVVFYMLVYALMTLGAFGVVLVVSSGSEAQYECDSIDSMQGLGWTHPLLGIAMTVAMLSLAGVPPLGGFMGKFYLFSAAVRSGYTALAVVAAINSVVSLYYYLRIVVVMYFSGERTLSWEPPRALVFGPRIALILVTTGTLYIGIFSSRYYETARIAARSLLQL
ncbi:MAG: NADH-quinone oxidoreductase subunit N [Bdellovibrionales bacterium]|nr:NADH-quinone oxidoreductase subunit N [Bdellovibrionales bacterium]